MTPNRQPHLCVSLRATPHTYRARAPIIGADFLAIEREARAQLERALTAPHTMRGGARRTDGTARAPFVRARESMQTEG